MPSPPGLSERACESESEWASFEFLFEPDLSNTRAAVWVWSFRSEVGLGVELEVEIDDFVDLVVIVILPFDVLPFSFRSRVNDGVVDEDGGG